MTHPPVPPLHWTRRLIYLGFATLFFVLAVVGAFLPVLPTTPFLLITSYFLVRSFPKLNQLLLKAPYFGPILYDWEVRRGIRKRVKLQAVATVLAGWIVSILIFPVPQWALIVMAVLVVTGILYILRIPPPRDPPQTAPPDMPQSDKVPKPASRSAKTTLRTGNATHQ